MRKATKKPVEIEYFTYDDLLNLFEENNTDSMHSKEFIKRDYPLPKQDIDLNPNNTITVETLEGNHLMTNKDFLIVGVQGEIYPCKIDIFNETYDILD